MELYEFVPFIVVILFLGVYLKLVYSFFQSILSLLRIGVVKLDRISVAVMDLSDSISSCKDLLEEMPKPRKRRTVSKKVPDK